MRYLALILILAGVASAQPTGGKGDAKSLMQTGAHLLEAKDYIGALAAFKAGYAQFPSAKFLLNMGTTQKLLDRRADAANSYQRYLDSSDTDPAKHDEVAQALAELDKDVGRVEINVTPDDAQVLVTDEWIALKTARLWRVQPGAFSVQAKREGYQDGKQDSAVAAGARVQVTLALAAIAKPEAKPVFITVPANGVAAAVEEPRSRFGAFALVHVSVYPKMGGAPLIGATADVTPMLSIDAGFLFGPGLFSSSDTMYTIAPPPKFGGYLGACFAFLPGTVRPRVSAGMPIFASNGPRFSLRGAAGMEYVANRNLSMTLDLGAEIELNPESDIHHVAFVPALGVVGRL